MSIYNSVNSPLFRSRQFVIHLFDVFVACDVCYELHAHIALHMYFFSSFDVHGLLTWMQTMYIHTEYTIILFCKNKVHTFKFVYGFFYRSIASFFVKIVQRALNVCKYVASMHIAHCTFHCMVVVITIKPLPLRFFSNFFSFLSILFLSSSIFYSVCHFSSHFFLLYCPVHSCKYSQKCWRAYNVYDE